MQKETPQKEISSLISDLFLSPEAYKQNKSQYLTQIKTSSLSSLSILLQTLKYIFSSTSVKPDTKVMALHFLKEAMDQNNKPFIQQMKKTIYPLLLEDANFQYEIKDEDRGKFFFSNKPDPKTKIAGNTYLRLLLECIEIWAIWYPKDEILSKGYSELVQLGVKFPSVRTYFKDVNEEQKFPEDPKERNQTEESEDTDTVWLSELVVCKRKLKEALSEDKIDDEELKPVFEKLKIIYDKIELLTLKKKGSKVLDDEKAFIHELMKSYKTCLSNDEWTFESLKENFFVLIDEPPLQNSKARASAQERKMNKSEQQQKHSHNSNQSKLRDTETMKTELLCSREVFDANVGEYLDLSKNEPENIEFLIMFLHSLTQNPTEKAISRLLALRMIKNLMELNNPKIVTLVTKNVLSKVVEIAKFNCKSKASNRYSTYFGETTNENIEKIAEDYVHLAIECIQTWSNKYPKRANGDKSEFLDSFLYLKDIGVDFLSGKYANSESVGIEEEFDHKFVDSHISLINKQMESLKCFLIMTKKVIKDKEFLPKMLDTLNMTELHLKKIPFSTQNLKEAIDFIKEFKKRYRKLENGNINFTQFKKRFLKFLGVTDGSINLSSKLSTSDLTTDFKPTQLDKKNEFAEKQAVFNKIPQKNLDKVLNLLEKDNIFSDFGLKSPFASSEIDHYYNLLMSNQNKNLEILVSCAKSVFEDPDSSYSEKLSYMKLVKKCVENGDVMIVSFIHDYLLKSIVLAIFHANFSKKTIKFDSEQQSFRMLALESIWEGNLKFKKNTSLSNFKLCWRILVEELMIEIPDKFVEKSEKFGENSADLRKPLNSKPIFGAIALEKMMEDSITLGNPSEGSLSPFNNKANFIFRPKVSFKTLFEENSTRIPLLGFNNAAAKMYKNSQMYKQTPIGLLGRNEEKIRFETKIIKENLDLKAQLMQKESKRLALEKELKNLKEKIKVNV